MGESELRDAQHLYMWHRLKFQNEEESLQGAIDSLVLSILAEEKEESTHLENLNASTDRFLLESQKKETIVIRSIENLERAGFARIDGESIKLLPAGKAEAEKHKGQFSRLCEVFKEQLKLDCKVELPSISDERTTELANAALNALSDLFRERAVELFGALFREDPTGVLLSLGMFRLLHRHTLAFDQFLERAWLIKYCTRILKSPKNHEIELLSYLARAFYCFQALQLDPEAFLCKG